MRIVLYFIMYLYIGLLLGCGRGEVEVMPQCGTFKVNLKSTEFDHFLNMIIEFGDKYLLHMSDRSDDLSKLMGGQKLFITFNDGPPITNILIIKNTGSGVVVELNATDLSAGICQEFKESMNQWGDP